MIKSEDVLNFIVEAIDEEVSFDSDGDVSTVQAAALSGESLAASIDSLCRLIQAEQNYDLQARSLQASIEKDERDAGRWERDHHALGEAMGALTEHRVGRAG